IVAGGLPDYYKHRTAAAPTAREVVPEFLRQTALYDHPEVQKSFVQVADAHVREAALILEGITCAACIWLNERHIARLPGVLSVHINYATHRARVRWDEQKIHLSDILTAISRIGYLAHPYDPGRSQQLLEAERKQLLRRLGVAGALTMQVMILAEALYVGGWTGMETQYRDFFQWTSLLLTLPVLLYSAQPFFQSAWRDLKQGRTGMDVPVSLGMVTAFAASVWTTVTGQGEVYYDSVTMFAFFLLTGRYFELRARHRAAEASETLVHATPAMATRLAFDGGGDRQETVPVAHLNPGDRVLIRPGEPVPADGSVLEGRSSVDESLLTGESRPITKSPGQTLIGGSINIESVLIARIEKTGPDTVLSAILRLLDRASAEKPRLAQLADRAAAWFVVALLLLTAVVAFYWWRHDPAQLLPIVIAVLVVTCPCALSLATPTALTAATGRLTQLGILTTRGHALETLARATHFVFDKTGTLTLGRLRLLGTRTFSAMEEQDCLRIASALERHSEHPIARALLETLGPNAPLQTSDVASTPGGGIQGKVSGKMYYLGTPDFVAAQTGTIPPANILPALQQDGATLAILASSEQWLAAFALGDELRPGARELIAELKRQGKSVWLLTGDHEQAARRVAHELGIKELAWDLKPNDKLEKIRALQQQGAIVAMVGDGVNDAPVLAAAQVSIAMGSGAPIAATAADMILLSSQLDRLVQGLEIARRALRIIRQNLAWALGYNLIAVPAAVMGYVPPWLAAIGMSASSLLVVVNALRLTRRSSRKNPSPAAAVPATL
ncbi:MAG: heavy metal translocating P-type ATPase, partial [Pseudomonadota bacterium]